MLKETMERDHSERLRMINEELKVKYLYTRINKAIIEILYGEGS